MARVRKIWSSSTPVWLLAAALLAGCGGGGGDDDNGGGRSPSGWAAGSFLPAASFTGRCVNPRSGTDPVTGQPYLDVRGTALDENNWLRSWSNDLYLWYDEIVDRDPGLFITPQYFDLLRTTATTPSGRPKDRFHFSYSTTEWVSLVESGVESSYGAYWAVVAPLPPRRIVIAYTEPGSPAASTSPPIVRGEEVLTIDGVDAVNAGSQADVDVINAGLFPATLGEAHTFTLRDPRTGAVRTEVLQSAAVTKSPVQNAATIDTPLGKVGYLVFNDHIATAEQALVSAFQSFAAAGVADLVLDVRYNGGGLLAIASQLGYMIGGPTATAGRTFEALQFNAKHTAVNPVTGGPLTPVPFFSTTRGYSVAPGQPLPTLNLPRVYVLTGSTTCSASESIINGLRGVNVEVVQIGSTTCGKPYGFYPADNCGTTYFSVQYRGVNAAGFGDYTDGFSPSNTAGVAGTPVPGCSVRDDYGHALGDTNESRLAAALQHRATGLCPAPSGEAKPSFSKPLGPDAGEHSEGVVRKSPWLENRSLDGL
jgi:hypothetical protein